MNQTCCSRCTELSTLKGRRGWPSTREDAGGEFFCCLHENLKIFFYDDKRRAVIKKPGAFTQSRIANVTNSNNPLEEVAAGASLDEFDCADSR